LPGEGEKEAVGAPRGSLEPVTGLQEAKAPLPYLRSRNALKIILDLDLGFGRRKDTADAAGKSGGLMARLMPGATAAASAEPKA
jgi:solute carrier family 25 (mitochondrial aspartate/glutamate transporter), member 12/13